MLIQCAWCRKITGQKPPFEQRDITHGMCRDCTKRQLTDELEAVLRGEAAGAALDGIRRDSIEEFGEAGWFVLVAIALARAREPRPLPMKVDGVPPQGNQP